MRGREEEKDGRRENWENRVAAEPSRPLRSCGEGHYGPLRFGIRVSTPYSTGRGAGYNTDKEKGLEGP